MLRANSTWVTRRPIALGITQYIRELYLIRMCLP